MYRNETETAGNWVALDLRQDGANRDAVGAWIELRAGTRVYAREITVGGGHAGGVAGPQHFGLGKVAAAQARVIWPDGTVSGWVEVPVNAAALLTREGDAAVVSAY
jgi:hypothetical protein